MTVLCRTAFFGGQISSRAGGISARHILLALILVLPLMLALGSLAGFAIGRVSAPPTSYRDQRFAEISADLRRVHGDYLLAAGDSHVVRWRSREFCGLPLVNAGIDGATARDTDALLAELALPHPPRAIILTVGTNDANRKRFRDPPEAVIRFAQAFRPLLRKLAQKADLVVVTGVPPLDARSPAGFSAEAAAGIRSSAEASCRASASCRFASSFRDEDSLTDGLHLADYDHAYRRIAPTVCAALEGARGPASAPSQNADADAP
ncbi:MAG TPA: SGNH/GDSL hydrolase family protein [Bosea sp. (in: a-proteobacteria)]